MPLMRKSALLSSDHRAAETASIRFQQQLAGVDVSAGVIVGDCRTPAEYRPGQYQAEGDKKQELQPEATFDRLAPYRRQPFRCLGSSPHNLSP
ncbi:MAG: hypothetical protein U5P41_06200 [Gammaproteobacteria bacterium]|nr:hypothetical protein [Gammaproteobacteria bacterium]